MKIALMSDSHDNWINLEKAVNKANELECDYLLFAGDLISPPGINILEKFKGKIILVWGNNEGEKVGIVNKVAKLTNIELCGEYFEGEIDSIKIFMIHDPRIAEVAAESPLFDLCIHGHLHDEKRHVLKNNTLLVNPGGLNLYPGIVPTITIFDTKTRSVIESEIE
jgi:uncharacterized protein